MAIGDYPRRGAPNAVLAPAAPMAFLRSYLRRPRVPTLTDNEFELALKLLTRLFPFWEVEVPA